MIVRRGDIFYADLRPVIGSEQGGIRPVLIIQNDTGNRHSPTVICAAITSKMNKAKLPTHVQIDSSRYDIVKDSVVLLEQLRTIDKKRLKDKVCHLDEEIEKRHRAAHRYREHLEGVAGLKLPFKQDTVNYNYAYFPVLFDKELVKPYGHIQDSISHNGVFINKR